MPGRSLPPGWEKVLDPGSGQYYFYNARQGVTQWDPPDLGSRSSTATFTTVTTTRKPKAGYTPRPVVNYNASFRQPVAYAHRSPRAVQRTTVHTTSRRGDRRVAHHASGECGCQCNGGSCTSGDFIFTGLLLGIVVLVTALTAQFGNGKGGNVGLSNRGTYSTYRNRAATSQTTTGVSTGCVASYDDVATTAQCGMLAEVLKLVNEHRASMSDPGVKPLKANALLNAAAQRHACWMADETTLSHTGGPAESDKELVDRVKKTGYNVSYS